MSLIQCPPPSSVTGGLLSWQYVPVKPLLQSQVNLPPDWLLHFPWGPQTFEEMYRTPSGVSLDAMATVQLSITGRQVEDEIIAEDPPRLQAKPTSKAGRG